MEYVVQPGDTIYEIGRRFGFTVDQIVAANPNLKDPNLIYPGEVLELPEAPVPPEMHPPWCCLILWSRPKLIAEPGMAMVYLGDPRRIHIVARKLPQPKTIDERCVKYMVWILSSTDPLVVRASFVLQPAYFADCWFSSKDVDGLCRQDHIRITVEPLEHGPLPTGPVVMENHMANCCHEN